MSGSRKDAVERGWSEVDPKRGYWARGPFRIQRQARGWRWWHVVQIDRTYPRGTTDTLRGALDAVDGATPTDSNGDDPR